MTDVYTELLQENSELKTKVFRLEQENRELSFAIEKCLENAGIECDDEEQALRSLPMLGNAHYKVLVEKEKLEQENKELKEELKSYKHPDVVTLLTNWRTGELDRIHNKIANERDAYRSALEEIRETAMGIMDDDIDEGSAYYDADQIITKINEVLGEKSET